VIRSKVPSQSYRDNWDEVFKTKGLNSQEPEQRVQKERAHMVLGDIEPFQSDDGTLITSRAKLRQHMKARGLAHADDFKEHWAAKAKERDLMSRGQHPSQKAERIRALSDAYEKARYSRN
jgi:hypothetical protein